MGAPLSLDYLLDQAAAVDGPQLVAESSTRLGGVDPLGLRQINFDLMDQVLPHLNNVAMHIRPYILMAWAWRRVHRVLKETGKAGADDDLMRDFVDRIEAIYVWSQFLGDPHADLPGAIALRPLLGAARYTFYGDAWEELRDMRRYSTGLISPLNYGPSLRSLGWLMQVDGGPGIFQPPAELDAALDAFEALFADELDHAVFNRFGRVTVERDDVARWGKRWLLDEPVELEKAAAYRRLGGPLAHPKRREGTDLIRAAWQDLADENAALPALRMRMADTAVHWQRERPPKATAAWRALQVRQAFRLALETLMFWMIMLLDRSGPQSSDALAAKFIDELEGVPPPTAAEWLVEGNDHDNPAKHITALTGALVRRSGLPASILAALRHVLAEPATAHQFERRDRLPLARAKDEADRWGALTPTAFVAKMIEVWVVAQHTYWCVTRGLTDARNGGKTILRMRIVMEEDGWTLTPSTKRPTAPEPTPDRLESAFSLLKETGRLS